MRLLSVLALATIVAGELAELEPDKRSIGLFSVVTFPNDECTLKSDSTMSGLCLSGTECTSASGKVDGNCASGFGVCCSHIVDSTTGGDVRNNITYIQNNGYPSAISTTGSTIDYNIYPCNNEICFIRYDFIAANVPITATTGACAGSIAITSPTGSNPPTLCGNNANYHMYSEVGRQTTATKVAITLGSTSTTRTWKIKVSQIECNSVKAPPSGCTQYFTGMGGTLESFNFNGGLVVAGVNYLICFRPEAGTCGMVFSVDEGTTSPNPFCLTTSGGTTQVTKDDCTVSVQSRTTACKEMYLKFTGIASVTSPAGATGGVQCGTHLNAITATAVNSPLYTKGTPYSVHFTTIGSNMNGSTGFKLNYLQRSNCATP